MSRRKPDYTATHTFPVSRATADYLTGKTDFYGKPTPQSKQDIATDARRDRHLTLLK